MTCIAKAFLISRCILGVWWMAVLAILAFILLYILMTYLMFSTEPCSSYFTDASGYISSPLYPENYFNNANCTYNINVTGATSLKLKFINLDIQCCCDHLSIYAGGTIDQNLQLYNRYTFVNSSFSISFFFFFF